MKPNPLELSSRRILGSFDRKDLDEENFYVCDGRGLGL